MENIKPGEQYNLRWNNYGNNILPLFAKHLQDETLVDVTLSCEGCFIKAHKLILSACSEYFRELFKLHTTVQHPIIVLNGIKFNNLVSLMEFIYCGEVKVQQNDLQNVLSLGDNFKVNGLYSAKFQENDLQEPKHCEFITGTTPEVPPLRLRSPKPVNLTQTNQSFNSNSKSVQEKQDEPIALLNKPVLSETRVNFNCNTNQVKPSIINIQSLEHSKDIRHGTELVKGAKKRKFSTPRTKSPVSLPETTRNVQPTESRTVLSDGEHSTCHEENDSLKKRKPQILRRKSVTTKPPSEKFKTVTKNVAETESEMPKSIPMNNNSETNTPSEKLIEVATQSENSVWRSPEEKIPRPPNAFMIFANEFRKQLSVEHPAENKKEISVRLGNMWKSMSMETKKMYYKAAQQADDEHKLKYPSQKDAKIPKTTLTTEAATEEVYGHINNILKIVISDDEIDLEEVKDASTDVPSFSKVVKEPDENTNST